MCLSSFLRQLIGLVVFLFLLFCFFVCTFLTLLITNGQKINHRPSKHKNSVYQSFGTNRFLLILTLYGELKKKKYQANSHLTIIFIALFWFVREQNHSLPHNIKRIIKRNFKIFGKVYNKNIWYFIDKSID